MGRGVNYLDNAEIVLYFHLEYYENEEDNYFQWENLKESLIDEIIARLPSYSVEKSKWGNNETRVIVSNNLCDIGLSEYCGCCSLSVAPKKTEYYNDESYKGSFPKHHARQIEKTLQKCLDAVVGTRMNKIATASNGESFFKLAKKG